MQLQEAISLIQNKTIQSNTVQQWADLGCGSGLFTHALASLLPAESTVYAVDKNISSFKKIVQPGITISPMQLDFITGNLKFYDLDGILMANSLHYVNHKHAFINKVSHTMKAGGCMLVVEYDTDIANTWVPYPLSFQSLQQLFTAAGYSVISKLHQHPSVYNRANIYSAIIMK